MKAKIAHTIFAAALVGSMSSFAQTSVTSEPVGFNTIVCPPGSDTYCGVPLTSETAFQGVLAGVPTESAGEAVITPSGTPGWTNGQFALSHYVRISSGAKAGMFYQILSNTSTTVTVDLGSASESLGSSLAGDAFKICKFWTLATLLPPASQTTVVPSLGNLSFQRRTEILFPDTESDGINKAPSRVFFLVGTEWRESKSGFPVADGVQLPPDAFFVVRHGNAAITAATTYTVVGGVEMGPITTLLYSLSAGSQDNATTHGRPVPVKLKDLELITTASFVPSLGTLAFQRRDELFVYDNAAIGLNKSPAAIYFYASGQWKKAVAGFPVADDDEIAPGQGFVIRKYQNGGAVATNTPWRNDF